MFSEQKPKSSGSGLAAARLILAAVILISFATILCVAGYFLTKQKPAVQNPSAMHKTNIPIVNPPAKNEVVVSIDKTLYGIDEPIKITLKNNTEKSIFTIAASLTPEFSITSIEQQKPDKTWEKFLVRCVWPECDIDFDGPSELKAGQSVTFDWTPGIHIPQRDMSLDEGVYRFAIDYQTAKNQEWLKSYFEEFTIGREICPDCGEKIDTSDWQTYKNDEYEISYPANWNRDEEYNAEIFGDRVITNMNNAGEWISIRKFELGKNQSFKDILVLNTVLGESGVVHPDFSDFELKKVGNKNFYYIFPYLSEGQYSISYWYIKEASIIQLELYSQASGDWQSDSWHVENQSMFKIFNQILSTFKFTEK